jgi:hypothetical protein
MRWRRLLIGFLLVVNVSALSMVLLPHPVSAATESECEGNDSIEFLPKWYKYLKPRVQTPAGGTQPECVLDASFPGAIPRILLAVFEILLRIAGLLAVIFIVYGGFQYLTSTGEPDKAKNARTTIINALVGLFIAMFSVAIVNVVGRNL